MDTQKGYSVFTVCCGKRQQYLKGHRKAIHSLLWWQATIFERSQKGYSQFVVVTGHHIWKVTERLFTVCCGDRAQYLKGQRKFIHSLLWWQTIIFERSQKGYSLFVVVTCHNIWKVTERLFTVYCDDMSQYLKGQRKAIHSLLWWHVTIFERSEKGYSLFVVVTGHNI